MKPLPLCAKPGCPNRVKRPESRYCSYLCSNQCRPGRGIAKHCQHCGKLITRGPRGPRKYCSLACNGLAKQVPLEAKFWASVNKDGPVPPHAPHLGRCWVWTGRMSGPDRDRGCLTIWRDGRQYDRLAHRVSWELHNGPPGSLLVCHHCDNPSCVRPSHLFLGTQMDNMLDMRSKGRQKKGGCPIVCQVCGKTFLVPPCRKDTAKWCSRDCYSRRS